MAEIDDPGRVLVLDTTLRDGAQTPEVNFGIEDKVAIARRLADLGVDIIEAGFPGSGPTDFEAVRAVAADVGDRVTVSSFGRLTPGDVEAACEAVEPAKAYGHARVHIGIATSERHMDVKLRKSPEEVVKDTFAAVDRASRFADEVQFHAEDATRTDDFNFLMEVLLTAVDAGATTLMVPDTVGVSNPLRYSELIRKVKHELARRGAGSVAVSAHCHNDHGLATINTLMAIGAGADQVEGTIAGIGERTGNASIEQIAMGALKFPDLTGGRRLELDTVMFTDLANEMADRGGIVLPANTPFVGRHAFMHDSGIHQDGVLKGEADGEEAGQNTMYNAVEPELVGQKISFSHSAQSGKAAALHQLRKLRVEVAEDELKTISSRATILSGREGRDLYDNDLELIAAEVKEEELTDRLVLEDFRISKGMGESSLGEVTINGQTTEATSNSGELDAIAKAIEKVTGIKGEIKKWPTDIKVPGSDAEVTIIGTVARNGHEVQVTAQSASTIDAEIEAYVTALNMLCRIEERIALAAASATPEDEAEAVPA